MKKLSIHIEFDILALILYCKLCLLGVRSVHAWISLFLEENYEELVGTTFYKSHIKSEQGNLPFCFEMINFKNKPLM